MAETEIKILITAVDNVSQQLDKINKNVDKLSVNAEKQTKSLANSFDKATGNLIVLGQAAERVDSIFDSYDNMLLRIENSQTRVYEAQKNVRDAQYNLNKVMQDGTATAEDMAKAQDDLDTASNRLKMSQNNLQRTMNSVTGTYIQIGVSVLTLASMYKQLWGAITACYTALIGPVGIVIGIIVAAGYIVWLTNKVGGIVEILKSFARGLLMVGAILMDIQKFRNPFDEGSYYQSLLGWMDSPGNWLKLKEGIEGQSLSPLQMFKDLKDQFFGAVNDMQAQGPEMTSAIYNPVKEGVDKSVIEMERLSQLPGRLSRYENGAIAGGGWEIIGQTSDHVYVDANGNGSAYDDFISRPGQGVSTFSPNDTIVGVKDTSKLGGITVNIDNVYGLDANAIAESLQRKLRSAIIV